MRRRNGSRAIGRRCLSDVGVAAATRWASIAILIVAGCSPTPSQTPIPSTGTAFDFPIECGPIQAGALCDEAVAVAVTAKLNSPPVAEITIRRPRPDDACTSRLPQCGPDAVIVTIRSGDTLQEVALVPTGSGWQRLDLMR
jgi:hypothetical protein